MKYLKIIIITSILFFINSCKKQSNEIVNTINIADTIKLAAIKTEIDTIEEVDKSDLGDTIIKDVNPKFIGREILGDQKKALINKYYLAINREVERPQMISSFGEDIYNLFEISEYKPISIQGALVKSYVVRIYFEDANYVSILLVLDKENYPNNCLMIYEDLKSEEFYTSFSVINGNVVTINRIDSSKKTTEKYFLGQNDFLEYYENSKINITEWGRKDNSSSGYEYQYILKGKIEDHFKNGIWDEKKHILGYYSTIWLHGEYVSGKKNGEWTYKKGDSLAKTEVYDMGKLLKTYYSDK